MIISTLSWLHSMYMISDHSVDLACVSETFSSFTLFGENDHFHFLFVTLKVSDIEIFR